MPGNSPKGLYPVVQIPARPTGRADDIKKQNLMKKILFICVAFLTTLSKAMFGQELPNILFVFIDDMGYGDLGCYGNKTVETPNIDRLANEGIRFSQYYSNAPICSPSRVAVTTGQYPTRWGITSFINDKKANERRGIKDFLDKNAPSVARNLQEAGYYTAHIGKWHMGGGRDIGDVPYIREYGFNESVTQFEGIGERYLATFETLGMKDSTRGLEKMSAALGRGDIHWIKREDFTKTYVNRVVQAIENARKAQKPFFINLWPDDVHTPLEPPRHLRGNGKTPDLYRGVIKELDTQLGRLFDYIRENPELKNNTLIVLTSDNGPARNVGSAGNFRGHKGNLFEGGIREPLIVWSPKLIPGERQGTLNEVTVVAGMDLPTSFISIAGAQKTKGVKYDGLDMSQALLGHAQPIRKQPVMWQRPPELTKANQVDLPDVAIREGDYKLLVNTDGSNPELYHLASDEGETTNLAGKYPKLTRQLTKKVLKWYSTMPPMVSPRD